jgi:hypothetical protein
VKLSNKVRELEQERHEEILNRGIFVKNRKDLKVFLNSLQQPQQPQQPPQLSKQQQHVNSLIKHLDEAIEDLAKKAKRTKSEINENYALMAELRENQDVSRYLAEKNAQKEKKDTQGAQEKKKVSEKKKKQNKDENDDENDDENESDDNENERNQNEQSKEKRKRVASEENSEERHEKRKKRKKSRSEETESDFENEEVLMTDDENNRTEGESSNSEEEREGRKEEEDIYDDREEYKNKISGEMDPEILPGSRIKVYWKGNGEWYLGRVVRWNETARQYEGDYDDEDEPILEHLTGPSQENWKFAREKRNAKNQVLFSFTALLFLQSLSIPRFLRFS